MREARKPVSCLLLEDVLSGINAVYASEVNEDGKVIKMVELCKNVRSSAGSIAVHMSLLPI
jgi:hypothetical protein